MNRSFILAFAFVISLVTFDGMSPASEAVTSHHIELLWPNGTPGAKGNEDGDKPSLTIYLPSKEKATGAAEWINCRLDPARSGLLVFNAKL